MERKRKHDHDAILKDWLAGLSVKELAAKHSCPGNTGAILARRRGVSRSPKVAKMARARAAKLFSEGYAKSPRALMLKRTHKRIADYAKRHGVTAAAAKFGYSQNRVLTIAKLHGWKPAPPRLEKSAILKDYIAGMRLAKIAEKHGCDQSYPSRLAQRAGKARYKSRAD